MRHFLSLVLALVLAPVIWVALAFGLDRTIRAVGTFASATNQDRLLGAGLLVVAGLALGAVLGTRLSPVGPALAGLVFLAASGLALSPTSPILDWGKGQLGQSNHTTLIAPLQWGLFWALGVALLIPLVVPSRWRRSATATVTPPGAPSVPANLPYTGPAPGAAGPAQSGAPGWSANPAAGGPVPAGAAPSGGPGEHDQGRPYQSAGSGGYRSEAGEAPSVPSWDTPPAEQGYPAGSTPEAYPPSTYQPTAGYSPTGYQATPYPGAYPGSEPASGPPAYPATNYPPTGYPASTYPASTYSASTYPTQPAEPSGYPDQSAPQGGYPPGYPAQPYPAQSYPTTPAPSYGGDPAGRVDPTAPSSPPAPTSYAPTTYGRSRSTEDPAPAPTTPSGPPALPPSAPSASPAASPVDDGDTEDQAVERHDATRRVQRPGPPPSWGGDSG